MKSARILILTAGYGEGHNSAARALRAAFAEYAPAVESEVLDLFAEHSPRMNNVSRRAYLGLINRAPRAWRGVYRWLDRSPNAPLAFHALRGPANLLARRIREKGPAAICSVYPVYPWLLNRLRADGRIRVPHYTVVTDAISVNSLWFRAGATGWFVTDPDSAALLAAAEIPPERVHVSGFPVALKFADRPPALHPPELQPGENPRILFMINSGRQAAAETARLLLAQKGWRITFTTGRDAALRRQIESLAARAPARADILGWTERVPELLMTHHFLVGKAGGATTQEALNANCPFIINQVVPGQEEGNRELIRRLDGGALAGSPAEILAILRDALADGARGWRRWRHNLREAARPQAARIIARTVLAQAAPETLAQPLPRAACG
jgi:processive 1,2-diacylglycerol beta-glucosyltransferase